jgi:predicted RNA-binding protein Jag
MEPEENAAAEAQAMGNAVAAETAEETVTTDEIKAVPMDSPAENGDADGFEEAAPAPEAVADAQQSRGERPRRTPPPVKPASPESMEEARGVLAHMFDFLGIDANIRVENKPRSVNLYVSTEEPGRVIGHHGKTLENLQLIVNRIMQKTDSEFPKLYIDMDGNRERRAERRPERPERSERSERPERSERRPERGERSGRREFRGERGERRDRSEGGRRSSFSHDEVLRQQALDAAKEVHQWGSPKTLPPMNSHDRRIVHITLEGDTDLTTNSIGDGENRSVVIALKEEVNA